MPVTIPPSLRPPQRVMTVAEQRRLQQPPTAQPVSTAQQEQLQVQQETLSNLNRDLSESEAQLKQMEADWERITTSQQIIDPTRADVYNQARSQLQSKIRNIKQAKNVAKEYLITYEQAMEYRSGLAKAEQAEISYQASQAERARQIRLQKGIAVPIDEVKRYEDLGYTKSQATILAQESLAQGGVSFTPEYAKQILQQQKIQVTKDTTAIVGYDWMGQPQYISVDPSKLTFQERERQKLGLVITPPPPKIRTDYERPSVWETGGTYLPGKEFVEVKGEPRGFGSFLGETIQAPADYIIGLPTREKKYTQEELFTLTPSVGGIPRRETVTFEQPKLPPGAQLEKERILTEAIEQTKYGIIAKEKLNELYNKYKLSIQEAIDSGRITSQKELDKLLESKRKLAEKDSEKVLKELDEEYKGEFTERERQRVIDLVKLQTSTYFWGYFMSGVLRAGFYAIPYYGKALLVTDIMGAPKEAKQAFSVWKEYPELRTSLYTQAGLGIAGMVVGGGVIGTTKSIIKRNQIKAAIETGETIVKSKGYLTESQIAKLNISTEQKLQLKNIIQQGGSIRKYETFIKYPQKTKYTPDIKGTFYEFLNSRGEVVRRISFGELTATLGRKAISKESLSDAILKVEQDIGRVGYMETIMGKDITPTPASLLLGKPKYKGVEKYKFYEETKLIDFKTTPKGRRVISKTTTELLGKGKYKGEQLLVGYGPIEGELGYWKGIRLPDYTGLKGTGKPFTIGAFIEYQKPVITKVEFFGKPLTEIPFVKITRGYNTFGWGVVQKVGKVKDVVKVSKPLDISFWKEKVIPEVKVKPPPPKPFETIFPDYISQDFTPLMVGGTGKVESIFAEKKFLVPFAGEAVTTAFAGEVPGTLTQFGGLIGAGIGVGLGLGKVFETDVKIIEDVKIKQEYIEPIKVEVGTRELLIGKEKTLTKTEQLIRQQPLLREDVLLKQDLLLQQGLLIGQTQAQKQKLQQLQRLQQVQAPPTAPGITFAFPGEFPPFFPVPELPEKPKETIGKGYFPEAYIDAKKGKKAHWKRLSSKPMSQLTARSTASKYVDERISARGRIVPSKKKKEKIISTKENYFGDNKFKFRTWKQVRGKRTKLPKHEFIEREAFRLDKPLESRGIEAGWKRGRRTPFGF